MEDNGNIEYPQNSTIMAVGTNPYGEKGANGYIDMDIYSVRIYNRGLTKEEIEVNSKADNKRYKQEEIIKIGTEEELLNVQNGKIYELKNDIDVKGDTIFMGNNE